MAAPSRLSIRDYDNGQRIAALEEKTSRLGNLPEDVAAMKRDIEHVKEEVEYVRTNMTDGFDKVNKNIELLGEKLGAKVAATDAEMRATKEKMNRWTIIFSTIGALIAAGAVTAPKWLAALLALL